MRAAVRERYGGPDVVSVRDVARPVPVGDQVLVRVHAASVNRADLDNLYPRWQFTRLFFGLRAPRNRRIGIDVAGVVEAVGDGVRRLAPGDRVFGDLFAHGQGAFADYICVAEKALATMPEALGFEEAAALPHSAILAVQALRRGARQVCAGQRVLIVGASGNVGPFAIQIAKAVGAHVTGVSSQGKTGFVRSLGADEVLDYTAVDPRRPAQPYDWIVDVDAKYPVLSWRRALRRGGVYVALGGSVGWFGRAIVEGPVARATGRSMGVLFGWKPFHAPDVERLKGMIAAGELRAPIDRTFRLEQVVEALRWVDDGKARGKVVIVPASAGLPA